MRRPGFLLSLLILFLLSFFLESSMFSFPMFLILGLTALNLNRSLYIFILLFLGGIVLDSLRGVPIGSTSFFLFATSLALYFYERYLGSRDILVIIVCSAITVIIYSIVLSYSLFQLVIVGIILLVGSLIARHLIKKGIFIT